MKVVVIIPVYNERRFIQTVVQQVRARGWDVIVVDDCSTDDSASLARAAGARVLQHEVNLGQGDAVTTGVEHAFANGYDCSVLMDGDCQHDPAEIARLVNAARDGSVDLVLGSRMRNAENMPWLRALTNNSVSLLVSLAAGTRITDAQSGFRLIKKRVWGAFPMRASRFDFHPEFLIRAGRMGFNIVEVPITTIYGDEVSHVNKFTDTYRFIKLFMRSLFFPRRVLRA